MDFVRRWSEKTEIGVGQGAGFEQPLAAHQHWQPKLNVPTNAVFSKKTIRNFYLTSTLYGLGNHTSVRSAAYIAPITCHCVIHAAFEYFIGKSGRRETRSDAFRTTPVKDPPV